MSKNFKDSGYAVRVGGINTQKQKCAYKPHKGQKFVEEMCRRNVII